MNTTAKLLSECESSGAAPVYSYQYDSIFNLQTDAQNIIVVSDIHLGAGLSPNGTYPGTENFFSDMALHRFLNSFTVPQGIGKVLLVINGDFIDFLRITTTPETDEEFEVWLEVLEKIGVTSPSSIPELKNSILTEKKEGYGLKTHDYKSVWKFIVTVFGHISVFTAFADWIAKGNQIIIVKGNHDLEWHWLAVRNYFRYILAKNISEDLNSPIENVLQQLIFPNIFFISNAVLINKELYIEHGHRYDNFTKVYPEDSPTFDKYELNLPFGSFFNRYLLNKIELRYPYFENVRPRTSLLPMLIKEDFPLAVKVFFQYIPFIIKTLGKKRYWPMIFQTFSLFFTIVVPALIIIVVIFFQLKNILAPAFMDLFSRSDKSTGFWGFLQQIGSVVLKDSVFLIGSYFLSRLISMLQLSEPESLANFAEKIMTKQIADNPKIKIITLGHTHSPEQTMFKDSRWYYNSGTWIPVIEASSAAIRHDRTYSFLKFKSANGNIIPSPLLRWNDDGEREEELILVVPGHLTPASSVHSRSIRDVAV